MPKVLIADALSPAAAQILRDRGVEVDEKVGLSKDELRAIIGDYDGLAVRSATKATADIIAAATRLKVIGRAGIGVDNIDIEAATAKGVVVMNTPFGNAITTAEHAISLMLALARDLPSADRSTRASKWEKSRFMGVEVTGKTLGLIGCGNIGSIVADRAQGLRMKVVAYDPFLTPERAQTLGVERVALADLFRRADFITLHTPLTEQTRNIIDAAAIAQMKDGVRIINCARGGLVVEADLKAALDSGKVAGAALDVFEVEPAKANPLFGVDNVVVTPHLGASTREAQENVALQIAEQIADYLTTGAVVNALNMPSLTGEEAVRLQPHLKLAEQLGRFAAQLVEGAFDRVEIEYEGTVAELNTKALTAAVLLGLLSPFLAGVNIVSAPALARQRGVRVGEVTRAQHGAYQSYIRLTVTGDGEPQSVAGTVFSGSQLRIIQVNDTAMEAELGAHMLYVNNLDQPGFIGALGTTLGEAGVNIATFHLGRVAAGGKAILLTQVDQPLSDDVLKRVRALPHVIRAKALRF